MAGFEACERLVGSELVYFHGSPIKTATDPALARHPLASLKYHGLHDSFISRIAKYCIIPIFLRFQESIMNNYEQSKKARRIASVVYILIMAVVMGGTYLSQQQKDAADKVSQNSPNQ